MMELRYLLPAEEEMTEAAIFFENQAVGLGAEFLDEIERTIEKIQRHPEIGPVVVDDLRRCLLVRFPFSLIYSLEPDGLLIVAVAHQRRRANYWRKRVRPGAL